MARGTLAILMALAVSLAASVAPASAGKDFAVKVAKHKDGPYKVDIKATIDPNQTRTFWWRVRNTGALPLGLVFGDAATSDSDGYSTRWFKAGKNVSSEVEDDGKAFNIDPGQRKFFSARQTADDIAAPTCIAGEVSDGFTSDLSSVQINEAGCSF